jgi:hypothetical protein
VYNICATEAKPLIIFLMSINLLLSDAGGVMDEIYLKK